MTEAEWLACTNPGEMLDLLRGKASERQLRLVSGQLCLSYMAAYPCPTWCELSLATQEIANHASDHGNRSSQWVIEPDLDSLPSILLHQDAQVAARGTWIALTKHIRSEIFNRRYSLANFDVDVCFGEIDELTTAFNTAQCDLLRDVFGNPFRPVVADPAWLTDTVVSLARGMYETRDFGAMPILADALQDAGCDNDYVLNHCRAEGVHVRGCWVIDLVLGKS